METAVSFPVQRTASTKFVMSEMEDVTTVPLDGPVVTVIRVSIKNKRMS